MVIWYVYDTVQPFVALSLDFFIVNNCEYPKLMDLNFFMIGIFS